MKVQYPKQQVCVLVRGLFCQEAWQPRDSYLYRNSSAHTVHIVWMFFNTFYTYRTVRQLQEMESWNGQLTKNA